MRVLGTDGLADRLSRSAQKIGMRLVKMMVATVLGGLAARQAEAEADYVNNTFGCECGSFSHDFLVRRTRIEKKKLVQGFAFGRGVGGAQTGKCCINIKYSIEF